MNINLTGGIKSPSAEAAEALNLIANHTAEGLAKGLKHAEPVELPEQCVAAYTRNSTNKRVTAHRWDGTKDSTSNISRWLARHGEEVWVQNDRLHARTLRNGATHALEVGDWVILEDNQAWSLSDLTFRRRYTFGEPQEKPQPVESLPSDPIPTMRMLASHYGAEKFQRLMMRQLIEDLGDRGALRLYLNVASEIDNEHC